jgi:hypothetical protein
VQEQEEPAYGNDGDPRGEQAIDLVFQVHYRKCHPDGIEHALRRGPERGAHTLLEDERQTECSNDGKRRRSLDRTHHAALDDGAQHKAEQRNEQEGQPKVASVLDHRPGQHGSHHEEVAVRHIDDVEQPKDDGQPKGNQGHDQAEDKPVHGQDQ